MSEGLGVAVRPGAVSSAVRARPARRVAWLLCSLLVFPLSGFGHSNGDGHAPEYDPVDNEVKDPRPPTHPDQATGEAPYDAPDADPSSGRTPENKSWR